MVEMAMPMGMSPFSAGTSGGSCDFRCSLSINVMDRMGSESAIKSQALDLATADRELHMVDPIAIYRLSAGRSTYRNKATGEIETADTLTSPDFNDELIAVWTDAGENGTGSIEEYQAIISRANAVAASKGEAAMFWISPGSAVRSDGLPEHRGYLWKKNESGEVTAYSYQFTGSNDSLSRLITTLSSEAEVFDSQSLLWQKENKPARTSYSALQRA